MRWIIAMILLLDPLQSELEQIGAEAVRDTMLERAGAFFS